MACAMSASASRRRIRSRIEIVPVTEAILSGILVGLALGLTGGGGSILAVPLLLGILGLALRDAVAVSLAVVGLTALYGAALQWKQVRWGAGAVLGTGGILGAPLGAYVGANWPESLTLGLFALLMLFIAVKMWRGGQSQDVPLSLWTCRRDPEGRLHFQWSCAAKLGVAGAITGVLSGIFGVGGGFLVVPALLLVTAMPISSALATSLVGIFLISAAAFASNLLTLPSFPTMTAAWFLLGGAVGMTGGSWWKNSIPQELLRRVFAGALIVVALWVGARAWSATAAESFTAQPEIEFWQDEERLQQGRQAAAALFGNLMGRLGPAMAEGGVVGAMKVCQTEAMELTGKTAADWRDKGVASIRRIGVRTRNPQNEKDAVDEAMLAAFLAQWDAASPTPPSGNVVALRAGGEVRYYHPVPVAASCLACHGAPSDMEPTTLSALAELYPADEATDFAEGDLRGAIVVTFASEAEKILPNP
jgi:uncharacterized membrane protein YfcA